MPNINQMRQELETIIADKNTSKEALSKTVATLELLTEVEAEYEVLSQMSGTFRELQRLRDVSF